MDFTRVREGHDDFCRPVYPLQISAFDGGNIVNLRGFVKMVRTSGTVELARSLGGGLLIFGIRARWAAIAANGKTRPRQTRQQTPGQKRQATLARAGGRQVWDANMEGLSALSSG